MLLNPPPTPFRPGMAALVILASIGLFALVIVLTQ